MQIEIEIKIKEKNFIKNCKKRFFFPSLTSNQIKNHIIQIG